MPFSRLALAVLLTLAAPLAPVGLGYAQTTQEHPATQVSVAAFAKVVQADSLFDVLRYEGLAQAQELADTMVPGAKDPAWSRVIDQVYDLGPIKARFNRALRLRLVADPAMTAAAMEFFTTDLGQRVLGLEIEARRAFLDIEKEEAARVAADTLETARDPKWVQIDRLIAAGDMVEMNVAAGLSSSLAFTLGLQETGATGMALPMEELSPDVWGQEEQLRADTSSWLRAYFGLAYAPLTEAELETYVAFMESPAGRHYSAALFAAFDAAFRPVSRDLGRAMGHAMQARDI